MTSPAEEAASDGLLRATVVHAMPGRARCIAVEVIPGTTLAQAVAASGMLNLAPSLPATLDLGVFGRPQSPETPVRDGDRIEVYRKLVVDPKTARRIRAEIRRRRAAPAG